MKKSISVVCLGDIVGAKGTIYALEHLKELCSSYELDLLIVNIENSQKNSNGFSEDAIKNFLSVVHDIPIVFTGGNHSFDKKSLFECYDRYPNLLRPGNFEWNNLPGRGHYMLKIANKNLSALVINVMLRAFIRMQLGCPFLYIEKLLEQYEKEVDIVIVDLHGEATGEKNSFAYWLDGRASLIFGTHTHVQTADERILPLGTAYITDIGMTGALHSSIGIRLKSMIEYLRTQLRIDLLPEETGPFISSGIIVNFEKTEEKRLWNAVSIKRLNKIYGL